MDYQTFRRELYLYVLRREEMVEKCVRVDEGKLCILWNEDGKECVLCWEVERLYAEFLKNGWKGVMTEIVEHMRVQFFLRRYPVVLRPLNFDRNRMELEEGVYWRFGDISLALYAPLYESGAENVIIQISRRTVRQWKMAESLLLVQALRVTCASRPPRLYRSGDVAGFSDPEEGTFMPDECGRKIVIQNDAQEGVRGYRLTALGYTNGAVALFYPGVQERLAELFGGDYYIGFISVHEAVVHPVRYKVLQQMKAAILRASVLGDRREVLTEKVYRYCCHQGRLVEV